MIYNAKNGYGLKLLGFDEQYEDCIIYRNTREEIIDLADKLTRSVGRSNQGLMSELNDMQVEAGGEGCFENKYTMPTYFINLILKKYKMELLG